MQGEVTMLFLLLYVYEYANKQMSKSWVLHQLAIYLIYRFAKVIKTI